MNAPDAWSGTPVLVPAPAPAPSLELATSSAWNNGKSTGRLLGEIDLAATPAAVRLGRSYVRELVGQYFGAARSELADLELLTSEAITSSVLYARPRRDGTVMLSALHIDRFVRVEVTDGGGLRGQARLPEEPSQNHARGLVLMRALAADHGTHRNRNGTSTFWFGVAIREGWRLP
ncbi:ATP-binding protein [Actinomadura macra]|uniref:ATP-binding protein n=1 Tax=Actinomadura macra TaxID=46164 RepID=UPI00083698C0|nr:ATP-binding protein [Actinomadura macra]